MIGWLAPWLLALVCGVLAASPALAGTVRHALVVGANDGGGVLEPLRYAESDAEKMANVLVELGEFDEQLVTVLYRPSQELLRRALARHASIAEQYEDDLFLFYYSGHADGSGLRLGDERYFFETLTHDLRAISAEVRLGVLDACRSGTITRLKGAAVTKSLFGVSGDAVAGEAWLTASAPDEQAQESEALRGGFFTHYLLSGMRGAADTNDGIVELEELYRYTYDRVVEATGRTGAGTQHPRKDYALSGHGALGITDLRHADALLMLRAEDAGQIAVFRLPDKLQLAEFFKRESQPMRIAVPPGRYLVRRRKDDATYEATFGLHEGGQLELADWGHPVMQFGVVRGEDPRVHELVERSRTYERRLNLGDSPLLAGGASLVVPGAGQLYNGQPFKGASYFAVTAALLTGVLLNPDRDLDRAGLWPTLGASLWGASIADAVYNVHRREERRPELGATLSWSGAYGAGLQAAHYGLSADAILHRGVSLGLDRVGFTPAADDGWDAHFGGRLMLAAEGRRWRPHALAAIGLRHGRLPGEQTTLVTRLVFSAGAGLRYYVVPRYFLELESRWQVDGTDAGLTFGVGLGLHLGR